MSMRKEGRQSGEFFEECVERLKIRYVAGTGRRDFEVWVTGDNKWLAQAGCRCSGQAGAALVGQRLESPRDSSRSGRWWGIHRVSFVTGGNILEAGLRDCPELPDLLAVAVNKIRRRASSGFQQPVRTKTTLIQGMFHEPFDQGSLF
jgi:hypothetical protein